MIEASAGTGKTYTLADLYVRLITEQNIAISKILVVTYTRAATQELRDRLRKRLVERRNESNLPAQQLARLNNALQCFDEVAIFTIHSFCQRVLTDYAFESGVSFDLDFITDDALLKSVADDFWRKEVTAANDSCFVDYLLANGESIDTLLKSVKTLIGKLYLNVLPPRTDKEAEQDIAQADAHFQQAKSVWCKEKEAVKAVLKNRSLLNGNQYRASSVDKWLREMAKLMALPALPATLFKKFKDFDRFTPAKLQKALKKNQTLPAFKFFTACERLLISYPKWGQARELQLQRLRWQLFDYMCQVLPQKKRLMRQWSYDDLLVNLHDAITKDKDGRMIARLKNQYQAVLIDEFQDTDPVQYEIFSTLFFASDMTTFLVGDPKQAIYRFRGADIFTYLKAKRDISDEHKYTLSENYRAHPDLVRAINCVFSQHPAPFMDKDIAFYPARAARDNKPLLRLEGGDNAPLQFVYIDDKKGITEIAAQVTADEIADLLRRASDKKAMLFNEGSGQYHPVTGGDIAVLVRSHYQAKRVKHYLAKRGISSVQHGRDNVFLSPQATMLKEVLSAIGEPSDSDKIKAALITDMYQLDAHELFALQHNTKKWADKLTHFYDLHQVWLSDGFMRTFRQLLASVQQGISVQQRLLALPDGERNLTNLLHLAELIQDECSQNGEGVQQTLNWLTRAIQLADSNHDNEATQLRLESDEKLVKIVTIHKSKGLQYPIVFCPFLWHARSQPNKDKRSRSNEDKTICFHNEEDEAPSVAFGEPDLSKAATRLAEEQEAEERRLLYVALTRARERCIIIWSDAKGADQSALYSLLVPALDERDMATALRKLVNKSKDTISFWDTYEDIADDNVVEKKPKSALSARQFKGTINPPWRIGSFTMLADSQNNQAIDDTELPDYDVVTVNEPDTLLSELNRFTFPRGTIAGQCLHILFESLDTVRDDEAKWQALVSRTLARYGFENKWAVVVCQWLKEVMATKLNQDGLMLNDIAPEKCLHEMKFYFPVTVLSLSHLKAKLLPLLAADSVLKITLNKLRFSDLEGFMTGFIDLVFEHQGKFYLADYKSNYLGDSNTDYHAKGLAYAMIQHHYPLQYLIYSFALHRYLKSRMKNYNPKIHLGGVYYLFIRGMSPEWGQGGVFYDAPDIKLLNALETYLKG